MLKKYVLCLNIFKNKTFHLKIKQIRYIKFHYVIYGKYIKKIKQDTCKKKNLL